MKGKVLIGKDLEGIRTVLIEKIYFQVTGTTE
jgi:hypothetical protein